MFDVYYNKVGIILTVPAISRKRALKIARKYFKDFYSDFWQKGDKVYIK